MLAEGEVAHPAQDARLVPRLRTSPRARLRRVTLAAGCAVFATSGLAVAGVLPDAAQEVVSNAAQRAGISIPHPPSADPAPTEAAAPTTGSGTSDESITGVPAIVSWVAVVADDVEKLANPEPTKTVSPTGATKLAAKATGAGTDAAPSGQPSGGQVPESSGGSAPVGDPGPSGSSAVPGEVIVDVPTGVPAAEPAPPVAEEGPRGEPSEGREAPAEEPAPVDEPAGTPRPDEVPVEEPPAPEPATPDPGPGD
jgi:hypothetical protein